MDRRKFIKSAGIATGAAAATSLATPAIAQSKIDMVIVSTCPRDFPGLGTGAQRLAARIGDRHESWLDEVEGLFDCATAAVDQQCLHPSVRERGEPVDDA